MQNNYKRIAGNINELLDRVQSTGKQEAMIVVEAAQFLQAILDDKLNITLAGPPEKGNPEQENK